MLKKITFDVFVLFVLIFAIANCSCNNGGTKTPIRGIDKKESVIPKIKTTNKNLKKISQGNVLGGEKILQLQIRTTNALFLAQKQKAQDLEVKLLEISKELEDLKIWNNDQAKQLSILEGNLLDVEIALSLKEDEANQLRQQNGDLKKINQAAVDAANKAQEEILKAKTEFEVKLAEKEKKIASLKKYRTIVFGVVGLLGVGLLFRLFGPRLF